jgi:hypothetical protein
MTKKIILSAIFFIVLVAIIVFYFGKGSLQVKTSRDDIIYKIKGTDEEYTNENLFENLAPGNYEIEAFGPRNDYYISNTYEVTIKRYGKSELYIELKTKETHPDKSGEEYGF